VASGVAILGEVPGRFHRPRTNVGRSHHRCINRVHYFWGTSLCFTYDTSAECDSRTGIASRSYSR